jgi:plasmid stabilization system protein ParE
MRPEAENEVDQSHLWYENQRKGKGTEFRRAVRKQLRFIARFPLAGLELMPGVRRVVVTGYPYIIVYRLLNHAILVESVFNTHQDPRKLQERIQSFEE